MSSSRTCFVVGGGIFGLQSAIAATNRYDNVILFDHYDRSAGSIGPSRILRTDYANERYMELAIKALMTWRENIEYWGFVTPCGRYICYEAEHARILHDINVTRGKFRKPPCDRKTLKDVMRALNSRGDFDALCGKDATYVYSPDDCSVNWELLMKWRRETALEAGVDMKAGKVVDLKIVDGYITRIMTEREVYEVGPNDNCTAALGAWTRDRFQDWNIDLPESHQPVPLGIISYDIELSSSQLEKISQSIWSQIVEIVPPPKESNMLKLTWLGHKFVADSELLSDPKRFQESATMSAATRGAKQALSKVVPGLDVQLHGQVQFCSMSRAGMPVIDSHNEVKNLIICIDDNATSAKLLPMIGTAWSNADDGNPDFPLQPPDMEIHTQPALRTSKTFQEVEDLAKAEGGRD